MKNNFNIEEYKNKISKMSDVGIKEEINDVFSELRALKKELENDKKDVKSNHVTSGAVVWR